MKEEVARLCIAAVSIQEIWSTPVSTAKIIPKCSTKSKSTTSSIINMHICTCIKIIVVLVRTAFIFTYKELNRCIQSVVCGNDAPIPRTNTTGHFVLVVGRSITLVTMLTQSTVVKSVTFDTCPIPNGFHLTASSRCLAPLCLTLYHFCQLLHTLNN